MLPRSLSIGLALGLTSLPLLGATIELKGEGSITGRILAEKPESVILDLGFTVISIPRSEILDILEGTKPTNSDPKGSESEVKRGLYFQGAGSLPERSVQALARELGEAVVQVKTPSGLGSGFIIHPEGYLITNFHVIEGENQIAVEVYHRKAGELDRHLYKKVRIIAMNKYFDLALLKLEPDDPPVDSFKHVLLGNAKDLEVGDRLFAIGSPLGLERTVTEGILSTKTRQVEGTLFLQTTAQINPGNSGGPLFNLRGEVVGVTNMKMLFGEGLGFAIPVDRVKYFLDHREAFAYDTDNPNNAYRYLPPPKP